MAKIKPFKAVIYNQQKINDLSSVICPPYDVISLSQQEQYHNIDPHNFIHILLGKNISGDDKYKRSKKYFKEWQDEKILIQEEKPSVYFYSQQYNIKGEKRTRLGFICLLSLGDSKEPVFGHEHTRLEPKEDRLRLLKSVKANLSPIFVIFSDRKRLIQRISQQFNNEKPFLEAKDQEENLHKIWKIDSPEAIARIQADMQEADIFIADGHHRYEVSCAYRSEMKRKLGEGEAAEKFNYILAYFTHIESRGLAILPIHRLVKLKKKIDLSNLKASLKNYFEIDEVKDKERFFFLMEKAARHVLGMYKDKRYFLLRLKNLRILDKMIEDKPPEYRALDVCALNYIILKKTLGFSLDEKNNITFSPYADELLAQVNSDDSYIAFFLNPVGVKQITAIALKREKMPPKSTFFYPKVASGLLINKF
ncbi:MAG: DUF1015 domain-containing protein [Candidatus Omnitrophica bacterium]|nr:DUF1015 domain-containing protein [Candidatus Omnitrophota bacterium]